MYPLAIAGSILVVLFVIVITCTDDDPEKVTIEEVALIESDA